MTIDNPAAYWNPLWESGRRYRQLTTEETALLGEFVGHGHGRPALDIGCGDGSLARHMHHDLGYRTTGIDCSTAALAIAVADERGLPGPRFQHLDIETDDVTALPEAAYALLTCRLVYAFIKNKTAILDRVRHLLVPGGTFWVTTPLADRLPTERKSIGITEQDEELLTANWSTVRAKDIDTLRCYALRP